MEAKIVQKSPFPVDVESGKTYYYCTCGLSENQPFCNGSHKGTGFSPLKFEAKETKRVIFVGVSIHLMMVYVMDRIQVYKS